MLSDRCSLHGSYADTAEQGRERCRESRIAGDTHGSRARLARRQRQRAEGIGTIAQAKQIDGLSVMDFLSLSVLPCVYSRCWDVVVLRYSSVVVVVFPFSGDDLVIVRADFITD